MSIHIKWAMGCWVSRTEKMKTSGQTDVSPALQWIFPNCQEGEVWVL